MMPNRMRGALALLGVFVVAPGCVEEERESTYPGDPATAILDECVAHEQSGLACDGSCIEARLNASCPAADDLWGTEEMDQYLACKDACAATVECADGRVLRDCACVADCAAQRSAYVEGLLAHLADCLATVPECE